jgi:mono/diheme cytochrome c family protein
MRPLLHALLGGALIVSLAAGCAHPAAGAGGPDVGNVANGAAIFETNCSTCHGASGLEGGVGPSLRGESRRKDLDATIVWIHHPQPPMPKLYPSPLTAAEVVDVASYVQSL